MTLKSGIHYIVYVCPLLGSYKSVAQHFQSVAQHFETMATDLLNSSMYMCRAGLSVNALLQLGSKLRNLTEILTLSKCCATLLYDPKIGHTLYSICMSTSRDI